MSLESSYFFHFNLLTGPADWRHGIAAGTHTVWDQWKLPTWVKLNPMSSSNWRNSLSFINPLNPSGRHADQNEGVSETWLVHMRTKTCFVRKTVLTRLVCVQTNEWYVLFVLESAQVTISTIFFSVARVAIIWPKITQEPIQNGGNWAEREN